jgi:shikimate dehydrogenase
MDGYPEQAVDERFLVGLIGAGIETSWSPRLHEEEADRLGLRCMYQLIDLDRLGLPAEAVGGLVAAAHRLGFAGLNITHPCKQLVLGSLDDLSPEASLLGAVNTVVFSDGRAVGHNTDLLGFRESFARGMFDVALDRVVLVGAGGAGAAVAHALLELGAHELAVVDAEPRRAQELAEAIGERATAGSPDEIETHLAQADGVVNATPVGMTGCPGLPFPAALLRPELWVADIVYRPLETELLRSATACGCRTLNGAGMAVLQAVESFRLFTGIAPDADRMLSAAARLDGLDGRCARPLQPSR